MKTIRKYFSDLREYREVILGSHAAILGSHAAIIGELQILNRRLFELSEQKTETLTRITAAAESLTEMQRAVLAQSHPHLVR
jgi:hypothetical protein